MSLLQPGCSTWQAGQSAAVCPAPCLWDLSCFDTVPMHGQAATCCNSAACYCERVWPALSIEAHLYRSCSAGLCISWCCS